MIDSNQVRYKFFQDCKYFLQASPNGRLVIQYYNKIINDFATYPDNWIGKDKVPTVYYEDIDYRISFQKYSEYVDIESTENWTYYKSPIKNTPPTSLHSSDPGHHHNKLYLDCESFLYDNPGAKLSIQYYDEDQDSFEDYPSYLLEDTAIPNFKESVAYRFNLQKSLDSLVSKQEREVWTTFLAKIETKKVSKRKVYPTFHFRWYGTKILNRLQQLFVFNSDDAGLLSKLDLDEVDSFVFENQPNHLVSEWLETIEHEWRYIPFVEAT